MLAEPFRIEQLAGQDRLFLVFVGIERRDALLGGAGLFFLQAALLKHVQLPVPGKEEGCAVADHYIFGCDGNVSALQVLDFLHQDLGIQGNAVAQNIDDVFTEHAGGQEMKIEFAVFIDNGMTGVAAALKTDNDIEILRQQVDHPAFAFVAPVDAYNCGTSSHCVCPSLGFPYARISYYYKSLNTGVCLTIKCIISSGGKQFKKKFTCPRSTAEDRETVIPLFAFSRDPPRKNYTGFSSDIFRQAKP